MDTTSEMESRNNELKNFESSVTNKTMFFEAKNEQPRDRQLISSEKKRSLTAIKSHKQLEDINKLKVKKEQMGAGLLASGQSMIKE